MAEKDLSAWSNPLDQASRYLAKLYPAAMIGWLLGLPEDRFVFRRWLDTRRIAVPGEADRENDTLAYIENVAENHVPWALILEFNIAPVYLMPGRLMEYSGMIWRDDKPSPERGDRFLIGSIVVNLTGTGRSGHNADWPEAKLRTIVEPVEVNLSQLDAEEILKDITELRVPRVILPWVPLMRGGERGSVLEGWKAEAMMEPDRRIRADYAALARIYADATGILEIWKESLKEWDMIESSAVNEWKDIGRQEGLNKGRDEGGKEVGHRALIRFLKGRFGSVPPEIVTAINSIQDLSRLDELFDAAAQSESLAAFAQVLNNETR